MAHCACGSNLEFDACCGPILAGELEAPTAERLMRARYSAFSQRSFDFLAQSLHPNYRSDHDAVATRRWAERAEWYGLEVVATDAGGEGDSEGSVEFIAHFKEKGLVQHHHERSRFEKLDGRWYFVEGEIVPPKTEVHNGPKVGRNEPCPCGSGKKYKKCCGR